MRTLSIGATVATLVSAIALIGWAHPAYAASAGCGGFDDTTGDYIACASDDGESGTGHDSGSGGDQPCFAVEIGQPALDSPIWLQYIPAGADPADYVLMQQGCGSTDWQSPDVFALLINRQPPPDPYALAQEAIAKLPVPLPEIRFGPDAQQIAVNVPMWLWVANPEPISASATDRTVTVTATAELASVTWSMGEPRAADFVCDGAGEAPWPGADSWQPPCGYTYRLRSLPERTAGAGTWQMAAEATWQITWSANTGESGSDAVTTRSAARVRVGEWRTVIVAGS